MLRSLCMPCYQKSTWAVVNVTSTDSSSSCISLSTIFAIVQDKALSEDARCIIYKLCQLQLVIIHDLTYMIGVHRATIHRIIALYESTGHFQGESTRTGRLRILDYVDTQVSSNWIGKTCYGRLDCSFSWARSSIARISTWMSWEKSWKGGLARRFRILQCGGHYNGRGLLWRWYDNVHDLESAHLLHAA